MVLLGIGPEGEQANAPSLHFIYLLYLLCWRQGMEYRYFGSTGMRVSAIGLGCNPFGNEVDAAGAARIVNQALDLGVTYFDTADSYFEGLSEEYLGQALKGQ